MAASSFAPALARVLAHEGGYSNHPADPGGPTMRGITQKVYDAFRRAAGTPLRPVRGIAEDELRAIYRRQYWDAVRADDLPPGLDYCVFDAAVNSGPAQAAKWLQRALGVTADGQVGALTLDAARAAPDLRRVIDDMCARRLVMLRALKTWPVFGIGWARRVGDVRTIARSLAAGGPAAPVALADSEVSGAGGGAKASPASIAPLPKPEPGQAAAAGGLLATACAEAARQIAPLAPTSPSLAMIFTVLTLAGLLVSCAGLAWTRRSARARDRRDQTLDLGVPGAAP